MTSAGQPKEYQMQQWYQRKQWYPRSLW
jgi:hypothetical protein